MGEMGANKFKKLNWAALKAENGKGEGLLGSSGRLFSNHFLGSSCRLLFTLSDGSSAVF
jgi:hypothetical protein